MWGLLLQLVLFLLCKIILYLGYYTIEVINITVKRDVSSDVTNKHALDDTDAPLPKKFASSVMKPRVINATKSLYDHTVNNAIILFAPTAENTSNSVHVVVDPYIGKHLRSHQQFGVQFLFNCLNGFSILNSENLFYGCILADAMGLGKTIQTISVSINVFIIFFI